MLSKLCLPLLVYSRQLYANVYVGNLNKITRCEASGRHHWFDLTLSSLNQVDTLKMHIIVKNNHDESTA
jgi:hypothetical protein